MCNVHFFVSHRSHLCCPQVEMKQRNLYKDTLKKELKDGDFTSGFRNHTAEQIYLLGEIFMLLFFCA